ncbi:organic hydroperoxide resistance protein [Polyangium jinanense]|uniref:Organic hydroperoxide resistance protein n=1 Tax=Polyangium jinanense TaxID=2829994 RepID=A0A9X4AVH7_9BACT|nr:organic hydroperoxide resistance protein [Polyangium jinanense]MDC3959893.1 organic hydroperoxide resistance protein [Polyangium jinanense]MDC3986344.1 organic hydroperoxide resistance protein [Polyangium jinanense]
MKVLYTATATATNGREGRVKTDDGKLDLGLSMPKSVGGPGGEGTNPEQLFALGYSACFGSALAFVARLQKIQTGPVEITAKVSLGSEEGGFRLAVELIGHIPDLPREQAETLMHAAHQACPYSKATRGNIDVKLSVA